MRIPTPFLILVLAVCISAQNANVAPAQPEPANSTLRARVFYEDTGRPVKRTSVMLYSSNQNGREATGTTDGEGNLEIRNLKAGKYYAIVNAPGVLSPMAYLDFRKEREGGKLEEQLIGFPAIVVNGVSEVVTQIPVRRGAAIGGRVTYANGDPAIGVKVEVLRKVEDEFLPSVPNMSVLASMFSSGGAGMFVTDDRGVYRVAGLPAGEYIVKVTEDVRHTSGRQQSYYDPFESLFTSNSSMLTVFFQAAFEKSKAQPVTVELGQEYSEVNIVIPDRGLHTIEAKIVAAKDKLPIRNARISIQNEATETEGLNSGKGYPGRERQIAYSDDKGFFKFVELPSGTYKLSVDVDNSEFDEKAQAYGPVVDDQTGYPINARAVNALMNTMASGSNVGGPSKLPARKFANKVQEFTIDDKDLTGQVIEMAPGATITGTVTTADGKELPDHLWVSAYLEGSRMGASDSISGYEYSDNGRINKTKSDFSIEGAAAGKTTLSVNVSGNEDYVKSMNSRGTDLLKDSLDIKSGEDVRNVHIVLARDTGELKGTVIDSEKQPIVGAELVLVPTDDSKAKNGSFSRTTRTDEKGEFSIKLPPFEYAVYCMSDLKKVGSTKSKNPVDDLPKDAPKFKITSGETTKATIKREKITPPK
jgi:hypothetical protein